MKAHGPLHSRREVMRGMVATGLGLAGAASAKSATGGTTSGALLQRLMDERVRHSPELATRLGLDTGSSSRLRWLLDDRSLAASGAVKTRISDQLGAVETMTDAAVAPEDRLHLDAVRHFLRAEREIGRFSYGSALEPRPYVLSHLSGAYASVPEFLASRHPLGEVPDAEAFLSRMRGFATALDQERERLRHDAGLGATPPDFILARTKAQLTDLRDTAPEQSPILIAFRTRLESAGLPLNFHESARHIWSTTIVPALGRQIEALSSLETRARPEAGVWRLPDGEAYYRASLANATTTSLSPGAVHATGRDLVEQLTAEADRLLRAQGLTTGTLAQRVGALYSDPRFLYPDDDDGRARLMSDIRSRIQAFREQALRAFRSVPRIAVDVRRVPPLLESGAPPAYYEDPSLDGSRPGTFYVNLATTGAWPRWLLASTVFHEAEPGHHLQQAFLLEGPRVPAIRTILWSPGYGEGWAVYAEQLAEELGMYDGDDAGRIGYVLTSLLRACRLVADTGVNSLRWSREQAVEWMSENGIPRPLAVNEVERYCVWPGQACSYMVGKAEWLRLRDRARSALGGSFDLRAFHAAGLAAGPVPLTMLQNVIDTYIDQSRARS
ncbi:DUF885 domain-containing protein [Sphingosinicella terrae]|uniref:DUF885 domain-containing protein n=1 Tax=Sphingosinicella terrae TaxID=2172047 RepID=UPI000E0D5A4A|nr:DUF885 family protein [Sphingosinicella terrae]